MKYVIFKNHPGDLIVALCRSSNIESFLFVANKYIPILKICFIGGDKFKLICKFPTNKVERQALIASFSKMLSTGEIFEFKL